MGVLFGTYIKESIHIDEDSLHGRFLFAKVIISKILTVFCMEYHYVKGLCKGITTCQSQQTQWDGFLSIRRQSGYCQDIAVI